MAHLDLDFDTIFKNNEKLYNEYSGQFTEEKYCDLCIRLINQQCFYIKNCTDLENFLKDIIPDQYNNFKFLHP